MHDQGNQLDKPPAMIEESEDAEIFTTRVNAPLGWKAKHRNVSVRRDGPHGDWMIEPLPDCIREEIWTETVFREGADPVTIWYADSVRLNQWIGRAAEIERRIGS